MSIVLNVLYVKCSIQCLCTMLFLASESHTNLGDGRCILLSTETENRHITISMYMEVRQGAYRGIGFANDCPREKEMKKKRNRLYIMRHSIASQSSVDKELGSS